MLRLPADPQLSSQAHDSSVPTLALCERQYLFRQGSAVGEAGRESERWAREVLSGKDMKWTHPSLGTLLALGFAHSPSETRLNLLGPKRWS